MLWVFLMYNLHETFVSIISSRSGFFMAEKFTKTFDFKLKNVLQQSRSHLTVKTSDGKSYRNLNEEENTPPR